MISWHLTAKPRTERGFGQVCLQDEQARLPEAHTAGLTWKPPSRLLNAGHSFSHALQPEGKAGQKGSCTVFKSVGKNSLAPFPSVPLKKLQAPAAGPLNHEATTCPCIPPVKATTESWMFLLQDDTLKNRKWWLSPFFDEEIVYLLLSSRNTSNILLSLFKKQYKGYTLPLFPLSNLEKYIGEMVWNTWKNPSVRKQSCLICIFFAHTGVFGMLRFIPVLQLLLSVTPQNYSALILVGEWVAK